MRIACYFLILLFFMALGACGFTRQQNTMDVRRELISRSRNQPDLAVLFIGNSYSFGVPKAFAKLAGRRGKAVHVDQETLPGWTLARHSAHERTRAKIRSRRWDIVVLQEQSRMPARPLLRAATMFPSVEKLAREIRGQGAIPVLYQTWGRRDDFPTMNRKVREGYQLASEKAGGLAIVPVGDAWEREFSTGRGALLFQADGSHPSRRGNELSAEVFYENFFGRGQ